MAAVRRFFDERNQMTRIDMFEQLGEHELAALRWFARRLAAPHLVEEVILPILREGDSQVVAAVTGTAGDALPGRCATIRRTRAGVKFDETWGQT